MRVHSIILVGPAGNQVRLERKMVPNVGLRVEVTLPLQLNHKVGEYANDRGLIYTHVVTALYGRDTARPPRDGQVWPNCTNSEANEVIEEVQRLFW
jgi:hypothetical protein